MVKRKHLVEKFSTFLEVDDRNDYLNKGWQSSGRLCNNIRRAIAADPNATEEYWAKHWLRQALQNNQDGLARGHLAAYLEEVCYWTIIKITPILSAYNLRKVDCFLIAREAAVKLEKIFKNYDFKSSNVKTYAQIRIRGEVLQTLRRGREKDKYSWPALLRNTSKKRLEEALKNAGIKEPEFSRCCLAFQCFKNNYVPTKQKGNKQLQPPNAKQLENIALFYREVHPNKELITGEQILELLGCCLRVLKETSKMVFTSLDEVDIEREKFKETNHGYQQSAPDEWKEIKSVLVEAFDKFAEGEKQIIELVMGLNINQGDLAVFFGYKQQHNVSRVLKRKRGELLKAVAEWSAENFGMKLSSEQLGILDKVVKEWLESYCAGFFSQVMETALVLEMPENVNILRQYFGAQKCLAEVAHLAGASEKELESKLKEIKESLQRQLAAKVAENYPISLEDCPSSAKSIAKFVDVYLHTAPYAILK